MASCRLVSGGSVTEISVTGGCRSGYERSMEPAELHRSAVLLTFQRINVLVTNLGPRPTFAAARGGAPLFLLPASLISLVIPSAS